MNRKHIKNTNVYKFLSRGSNTNLLINIDEALRKKKPFKVTINESTYDLVPLMSFVLGGNIQKNHYFDNRYMEAMIVQMIINHVEKDAYKKSSISQKVGILKPDSDAWIKCIDDEYENLFEYKVWDYTTILYTLINYNPWEYSDFARYYATYLCTVYLRGLESKKISDSNLLYNLLDKFIMGENDDYYKDYEEGKLKFNTLRGMEFVFINLFKLYILDGSELDEKTKKFVEVLTKDIALCKFLKMFEVDEYGQINRETSAMKSTNYVSFGTVSTVGTNVRDRLYGDNYDYEKNEVKRQSDMIYNYSSYIMKFIDEILYGRLNSEFQFWERKDVVDIRYDIEVSKNTEIKKLNNEVKRLYKSVDTYKSSELKTRELLKDLRIKASNHSKDDDLQSKDKEIEELKKKLVDKDVELSKVTGKLDSTQKRVDTLEAREIKINQDAEDTIKELELEISNLENTCDYYESALNETTTRTFEYYKNEVKDMRVCVVGGPIGFDKRLQLLSKNITFFDVSCSNYSFDLPQCDIIVINSAFNSHSHADTARRIAKSRGIPFIRTQVTNIELLAKLLYQFKLTV